MSDKLYEPTPSEIEAMELEEHPPLGKLFGSYSVAITLRERPEATAAIEAAMADNPELVPAPAPDDLTNANLAEAIEAGIRQRWPYFGAHEVRVSVTATHK